MEVAVAVEEDQQIVGLRIEGEDVVSSRALGDLEAAQTVEQQGVLEDTDADGAIRCDRPEVARVCHGAADAGGRVRIVEGKRDPGLRHGDGIGRHGELAVVDLQRLADVVAGIVVDVEKIQQVVVAARRSVQREGAAVGVDLRAGDWIDEIVVPEEDDSNRPTRRHRPLRAVVGNRARQRGVRMGGLCQAGDGDGDPEQHAGNGRSASRTPSLFSNHGGASTTKCHSRPAKARTP